MGRLTASMPVIVEPDAHVRDMSDRQLLDVLMRSPAQAKPCTRPDSDQVEWLRPATSRLSDRQAAAREEMRARRLCAGCPVLGECLELSLRGPVEGVQGGATERSRQTLRYRRAGHPGAAGHPRPGSGHCPQTSGRPRTRRSIAWTATPPGRVPSTTGK